LACALGRVGCRQRTTTLRNHRRVHAATTGRVTLGVARPHTLPAHKRGLGWCFKAMRCSRIWNRARKYRPFGA